MTTLRDAFEEGRNSNHGTDRHHGERAWMNSSARRAQDAADKARREAIDEASACRPDAKPAPVTGPNHGASIPEQFRLLRSLIGTDHPRGIQNIRDIVDYLESVFPKEQPGPPAILFDVDMAWVNEWCWYVRTYPGDDDEYDARSVERDGERRIYFESARAILAELNIDEPDNLRAILLRDFEGKAE